MRFYRPTIKIPSFKIKRQFAKSLGSAFLLAMLMFLLGQINFGTHAAATNGLNATYFGNQFLSDPKLSRVDDAINFNWMDKSPDSKINRDNFSVRWEGFIQPRYSETYTFSTLSDDGVRLWINNQLIIDNWSDHPTTENLGTINLSANQKYSIKMEFYENWGMAQAQLFWASPTQPKEIVPQSQLYTTASTATVPNSPSVSGQFSTTGGVTSQFFKGRNFTTSVLTRNDNAINFDWGANSPDPKVSGNDFSARFSGKITPKYSENYTFYSISDDGVRVWVNNLLVINNWSDHPVLENIGILALQAGQSYDVKVEYYENSGQSVIELLWSSASQYKEVVPFTVNETVKAEQIEQQTAQIIAAVPAVTNSTNNNPFGGAKLYVNQNNDPSNFVRANQQYNSYNAQMMDKIAKQPEVEWLGNWNSNITSDVSNFMKNITDQSALPVFVVYNIPYRDCGGYSSGGVNDPSSYRNWISQIASTIGGRKAVVILEPDAITLTDCLSADQKTSRFQMLRDAVSTFNAQGNISVYLDAGHPNWLSASEIGSRLKQAGVDSAAGFVLNIANFYTNDQNAVYGKQISDNLGGKHFLVDTGRNGSGTTPDEQWCNPWGRSLGTPPTTNTGNSLIDAYLWVKGPSGSDGQCNGGPAAGQFWPDYAIGLAQRTNW